MRPIDGDYISDALEAELCREGDDLEDRQWAYGYAAGVSFAVRKLAEAPTLTPPNEPLTLEELREMEQSTPVWWDYIPCWVLVRRGSVLVFGSEPHKVENLFGYFYRRPPEGEEDT